MLYTLDALIKSVKIKSIAKKNYSNFLKQLSILFISLRLTTRNTIPRYPFVEAYPRDREIDNNRLKGWLRKQISLSGYKTRNKKLTKLASINFFLKASRVANIKGIKAHRPH